MRRTRTHANRLFTWLNMGLEKEVAWDFSAASSLAASKAFSIMRNFYIDGDKVTKCMRNVHQFFFSLLPNGHLHLPVQSNHNDVLCGQGKDE